MGIKRLEAEIKELSRRLSKLEARKEGPTRRSTRIEPIGSPPHAHAPEGQATPDLPADRPGPETIEFRSAAAFEQDLEGLDRPEQQRIVDAVNAKSALWLKDRRKAEKAFLRPYRFLLRGELESSLCEIRVGRERSVIMTVDDDPIFDQVIVTLMRVVPKSERKAAYLELAERLYPGQIVELQTPEDP